jgi:thioredoxin reductase (NADPH)
MRALLIAEADLGERLMRALILRRTQMLQDGVGGPVIVGRSENPKVRKLFDARFATCFSLSVRILIPAGCPDRA